MLKQMFLDTKWFILYVSLVTELMKHEVLRIFKERSQRLLLYLCEPTIFFLGHNFSDIKYHVSFYPSQNVVIRPSPKTS